MVEFAGEAYALFLQDRASLSLHQPAVNYLQHTVLQIRDSDLVLIALPLGRSEVLLLCFRYVSPSLPSSSPSAPPLAFVSSRSLELPHGSSLRCMCWLSHPRGNYLAVATSDKVLLYSVAAFHSAPTTPASASIPPPELLLEVPAPAKVRITQLLPLDNQDAHLHLVLHTSSLQVFYLHLHYQHATFLVHTHHLFDRINALCSSSSLQGIHVLDAQLQQCSYYSAAYIHTRLATATPAPFHTRESTRLDLHTEQVLALGVTAGHAIICTSRVSSLALPSASASTGTASSRGGAGGGFRHVLAGTRLSEALYVPHSQDEADDVCTWPSQPSGPSALDRLLQVCPPPLAVPAASVGGVHSFPYPLDGTRHEHGRQSLGDTAGGPPPPPRWQLTAEVRDQLVCLPRGVRGEGWLALGTSTAASVELCAVSPPEGPSPPGQTDARRCLTLSSPGTCRGLAVLCPLAASSGRPAGPAHLLVLQADRLPAPAEAPLVALSTWRDVALRLLACPLRGLDEEPAPAPAPAPAPVGVAVDPSVLQLLQGMQAMLATRFAHVDDLLASQQATIARLQAEVHTLRTASVAAQAREGEATSPGLGPPPASPPSRREERPPQV